MDNWTQNHLPELIALSHKLFFLQHQTGDSKRDPKFRMFLMGTHHSPFLFLAGSRRHYTTELRLLLFRRLCENFSSEKYF